MTTSEKKISALGLCSGGLDSILSALILKDQGVDVTWISFETPFFSADNAREAARMTGIDLIVKNITAEYMDILHDPPAGFGKNMNPCMDCHALMFRLAGQVMEERGDDFLFSGEVLGQRPKSQTKNALNYVAKHSGHKGYVLRPLSALKLDPTIVENQGLVDREKLLGLSGRSRKPQMELAENYGITTYPAPAGGCLLTDIGFSDRLRDLMTHQEEYGERDFELLKHGRHFRLGSDTKAIVGRNRADNERLSGHIDPTQDIVVTMADLPGPIVILPHGASREMVLEAARLCAAYGKAQEGESASVAVAGAGNQEMVTVTVPDKEIFSGNLL